MGKGGKLSPRFIGPFEITQKVRKLAYLLKLPNEFEGIHDVIHFSYLRKTLFDKLQEIFLKDIQIHEKLRYQEEPE